MSSFGPAGQPSGYEAWQDGPSEQPKLSILALASLIFSILCLTAPIGLILGIAALFTISASAGRRTGRGLAIAGVVIGLLFSSLLVAVVVGINSAGQMISQQMSAPTTTFLQDLEAGNFTKARTALTASAQSLTDADMTKFRDAYVAKVGKIKGAPVSLMKMISSYSGAGQAMQSLQNATGGQMNNLIPLPFEFDTGWAIVGITFDPQAGPPGSAGSTENIVVAANDGTTIWLRDPATVPTGIKIRGPRKVPGAPPVPAPPVKTDEPAPGEEGK